MEFDKANVFTALNADEARVGSKGYFSDCLGQLKELVSNNSLNNYGELTAVHYDYKFNRFEMNNTLDWLLFYLVKEPGEKGFRPFKNTDDMMTEFCRRSGKLYPATIDPPAIYFKNKESGRSYIMSAFDYHSVKICHKAYNMVSLFNNFTFTDGSPCGIEE